MKSDKYFEAKLNEIIGSGKEKITDILKQIARDQRKACVNRYLKTWKDITDKGIETPSNGININDVYDVVSGLGAAVRTAEIEE